MASFFSSNHRPHAEGSNFYRLYAQVLKGTQGGPRVLPISFFIVLLYSRNYMGPPAFLFRSASHLKIVLRHCDCFPKSFSIDFCQFCFFWCFQIEKSVFRAQKDSLWAFSAIFLFLRLKMPWAYFKNFALFELSAALTCCWAPKGPFLLNGNCYKKCPTLTILFNLCNFFGDFISSWSKSKVSRNILQG